jgi:hypothetical protein
MPDIAAPTYPTYQPTQNNALASDPAKVVGLMGALNQQKLFNATFPAVSQQPEAALQGQNIANTTSQNSQNEAAAQIVAHHLGTLPDNASRDDFFRMKAAIRAIHPNIPASTINTVADIALREPRGIKQGIATLRTMGTSPESMVSPETGPPSASGAPTVIRHTTAIRGGGFETGLAPGEAGLSESAAGRAAKLQSSASTSPQYHADLENLKADSKILDNLGGPTFEVEKKLNQLSGRLGGFGITMTPEQLKAGESFDKIANQISLNQSQLFHGSDAGLHTVVGANPSTSMSKFGREGVIDMLHGNQDAIDATRKAWLAARANGAKPGDYDLFAERMGQEIDPRVFQFNRLNRENQQKFLSQMDPGDMKEFEGKFKNALSHKWVKPLKAPEKTTTDAGK